MPEPCAFLFANGDLRDAAFVRRMIAPGDWLAAADGGLRHLLAVGGAPDLLIGDFDSLTAQELADWQSQGVPVVQRPQQKDETDLELALDEALRSGFRRVRIVAALGGRLDHTLGNLALLADPRLDGLDARMEDGVEEALLARDEALLLGEPGDRVSLIPWGVTVQGARTEGLAYPLRGETLLQHSPRGVSNVMTSRQALVRLEAGQLLVIHTRQPDLLEVDR